MRKKLIIIFLSTALHISYIVKAHIETAVRASISIPVLLVVLLCFFSVSERVEIENVDFLFKIVVKKVDLRFSSLFKKKFLFAKKCVHVFFELDTNQTTNTVLTLLVMKQRQK